MSGDPRLRPAVRAVVMDPDRRVLLVHFDFEDPGLPTGLWACPGGGVDPGETPTDALRRELREELGLVVEAFEPAPQFTEAELQAEHLDDVRWWTWAELREAQRGQAVDDRSHPDLVTLSPRPLVRLLEDLMAHGRPGEPLRLGPL